MDRADRLRDGARAKLPCGSRRDLVGVVEIKIDRAAEQRLHGFLDGIGDILGTPQRRENFARYAIGLIGDGDRKSVEPIVAERARAFPPSTLGAQDDGPIAA